MIEKDPYIHKRRKYSSALVISLLFTFQILFHLLRGVSQLAAWQLTATIVSLVTFALIATQAALLLKRLPKNRNKL